MLIKGRLGGESHSGVAVKLLRIGDPLNALIEDDESFVKVELCLSNGK